MYLYGYIKIIFLSNLICIQAEIAAFRYACAEDKYCNVVEMLKRVLLSRDERKVELQLLM